MPVLKFAFLLTVAAPLGGGIDDRGAAVITAVDQGDGAALKKALEGKPNLDPSCEPYAICKPLALAASHGDLAMVKMLVEAGADPNGRNAYGDTAFMVVGDWLSANGKPSTDLGQIRAYLLRNGTDPNLANDDGATAFMGSAAAGDIDAMDLCLQHGGIINKQTDKIRYTPLMAAAQFGELNAVRWLLAHGADLHLKDSAGRTALQIARDEKRNAVVAVLETLSSGARGVDN
jgi:ankyrin repeat protein